MSRDNMYSALLHKSLTPVLQHLKQYDYALFYTPYLNCPPNLMLQFFAESLQLAEDCISIQQTGEALRYKVSLNIKEEGYDDKTL